jgi:cytoplasmic iron level regulating protein YaaA (DUF328/UPF0246 family)
MLALLSPAKTLDYSDLSKDYKASLPIFHEETQALVHKLKKQSKAKLKSLMSISDKLAEENAARYKEFGETFTKKNSKEAIFAFNGDVYRGLDAESLNKTQINYAQKHVRILSGLYGILKPLDLMQPYRLEMGTKLSTRKGKNLYEFWDDKITNSLNEEIKSHKEKAIINLASVEYFKSVKKKQLEVPVINVDFKEYRDGKLKHISFNAKRARGMMARYMAVEKVKTIEDLKEFDMEDYGFSEENSSDSKLLFVR